MERRKFLSWVGIGALATSLPTVLAACSSTYETSTESVDTSTENVITSDDPIVSAPSEISDTPDADGFYSVGTLAAVASGGAITSKKFASASGALIVVEDPAAPDGVVALDARCTHQGCSVELEDGSLVCPCHGSAFATDGSVEQGPAEAPLTVFETKVEGEQIFVRPA